MHARGKALAKDIDFDKIARRTPGFTGADLQNLMNEAAIMAARRNLKEISKDEIADALERIVAGPEKVGADPVCLPIRTCTDGVDATRCQMTVAWTHAKHCLSKGYHQKQVLM